MKRTAFSLLLVTACAQQPAPDHPLEGLAIIREDPSDLPLRELSQDLEARFVDGDALFDKPYRETQGLGPYYIRESCSTCHKADGKGPGSVTKMVVIESDGVTPASDQSMLPFGHTQRPLTTAAAPAGLMAPKDPSIKKSIRIGPAVFGRGYMEAIADSEIERMEAEQAQRTDGVSGRINRVVYRSEPNTDSPFNKHATGTANLIGRFGVKARIATLDEFAADAFQGDMGITSPLRPIELPNPSGLDDDGFSGVDVPLSAVNLLGDYLRLLDIPRRAEANAEGAAAFAYAQCGVCHAPALATRPDYPIPALAGVAAPIYSDMLLHDMGPKLADGLQEESAGSREWRTAPLMGLRFFRSYMHDGRAQSVSEAISQHQDEGSEANASIAVFASMSDAQRAALIAFVEGL